jgi:cellulose biosynthesis protein BcsQ
MNIILLVLTVLLAIVNLIIWIKDIGKNRELNTYKRVVSELDNRMDRQKMVLKRIRETRMLYTRHPAYVEVRRQIEILTDER